MNPKIWGPSGWKFLYSVACDYPERPDSQQTEDYRRFFEFLRFVLPCVICCLNYNNHLHQINIEPYLTSKENLFTWILKMENLVRKEHGKAIRTRKDIQDVYFNGRQCLSDCRRDPRIWGREGWKFLFAIAHEYPIKPTPQDISNYKSFFTFLQYVLPCESYRRVYSQKFTEMPINSFLTTKTYLFEWVLQMHNAVNKDIGRPLMTHAEVIHYYFQNQIHSLKTTQEAKGSALVEGFVDNTLSDTLINNKNIALACLIGLVVAVHQIK